MVPYAEEVSSEYLQWKMYDGKVYRQGESEFTAKEWIVMDGESGEEKDGLS